MAQNETDHELVGGPAHGKLVRLAPGEVGIWIPEGPLTHEYCLFSCGFLHLRGTYEAEPDGDAFEREFAAHLERQS